MARGEWAGLCGLAIENLDKIAPSLWNEVANEAYPSVVEAQIIWQSVFKISIATVRAVIKASFEKKKKTEK